MGRPTKLTPERSETILEAIRKGHSNADACRLARINQSTFYAWLERGRRSSTGPYKEFSEKIADTECAFTEALVRSAMTAATEGQTKLTTITHTVKDADGRPLRTADGKLEVEVTERKERIPPDGKLALEIMSRRRPDDWGRRVALEHSGPTGDTGPGPIEVRFIDPPSRDGEGEATDADAADDPADS